MRRKFAVLLLALLGLFATRESATAQLSIDAGLYLKDVQVLYLNDLDLTSTGSGRPLFWVRIRNDGNENLQAIFKLVVESDNPAYGVLAEGKSKPFWVGHGQERLITNNDLSQAGNDIELDDYTIYDSAKELANTVLATGKLPNGVYRFKLRVQAVNDPANADETTVELNITNPTTIQLVTPGAVVEEGEVPTVYTTLPQFVWDSNASEFDFKVCEKLPSNSSPEDVMQNEPRYHTTTGEKSLVYPSSGAYPLEEGHTYYWQVRAIVQTSSGPVELESEIWGFRVGSASGGGATAGGGTWELPPLYRNVLSALLGNDAYESLFGDGGVLYECTPTGVIRYQGASFTLQDVQMLLQSLRSGKLEIVDYRVE